MARVESEDQIPVPGSPDFQLRQGGGSKWRSVLEKSESGSVRFELLLRLLCFSQEKCAAIWSSADTMMY